MVRVYSLTAAAPTTSVHHGCFTSDGCADVQQQRPALHGDQLGRTKRRRWTLFMLRPITNNGGGCGSFGWEKVKLESWKKKEQRREGTGLVSGLSFWLSDGKRIVFLFPLSYTLWRVKIKNSDGISYKMTILLMAKLSYVLPSVWATRCNVFPCELCSGISIHGKGYPSISTLSACWRTPTQSFRIYGWTTPTEETGYNFKAGSTGGELCDCDAMENFMEFSHM